MPDAKIISVTDFIVTETVIDSKCDIAEVEHLLKSEKSTGKVQFDVSRGGHQRFLLTERTKVTGEKSSQIRKIMDWKDNSGG